jgi:hypothetical protein
MFQLLVRSSVLSTKNRSNSDRYDYANVLISVYRNTCSYPIKVPWLTR